MCVCVVWWCVHSVMVGGMGGVVCTYHGVCGWFRKRPSVGRELWVSGRHFPDALAQGCVAGQLACTPLWGTPRCHPYLTHSSSHSLAKDTHPFSEGTNTRLLSSVSAGGSAPQQQLGAGGKTSTVSGLP